MMAHTPIWKRIIFGMIAILAFYWVVSSAVAKPECVSMAQVVKNLKKIAIQEDLGLKLYWSENVSASGHSTLIGFTPNNPRVLVHLFNERQCLLRLQNGKVYQLVGINTKLMRLAVGATLVYRREVKGY